MVCIWKLLYEKWADMNDELVLSRRTWLTLDQCLDWAICFHFKNVCFRGWCLGSGFHPVWWSKDSPPGRPWTSYLKFCLSISLSVNGANSSHLQGLLWGWNELFHVKCSCIVRVLFTYPCMHSLLIHSTPVHCTLTVFWALWRRLALGVQQSEG